MQVGMGETALGTQESGVQGMFESWVFISIFNCEDRKGSGKKIRKQKLFSYLGPGWSGGRGLFLGQ